MVHENICESPKHGMADFLVYVRSLVEDIYRSQEVETNRIGLDIKVEDVFLDVDTATSCGLIINELVSNSIKHAFSGNRDGLIGINIHSDSNELTMIISDNGIGLSERIDFDNIDTLGLQLVKTLIGEIDAKIELKERNGTEFLIKFNHEIQKN